MEGDEEAVTDNDELMEGDEPVQTEMSISEYAKARHITPQLVHYYIRNKRLNKHKCSCGRPVINIEEADIALRFKTVAKEEGGEDDGQTDKSN